MIYDYFTPNISSYSLQLRKTKQNVETLQNPIFPCSLCVFCVLLIYLAQCMPSFLYVTLRVALELLCRQGDDITSSNDYRVILHTNCITVNTGNACEVPSRYYR